MNSSTKQLVCLFVLLILLGTSCDAGLLRHKQYVEIKNLLPGEATLTIHCKSKDDDLGSHVLGPLGTFSFHFRPRFIGLTLFFCSFQWKNSPLYYYDIYKQSRDYDRCTDCLWGIQPNGPCLLNDTTHAYTICDQWNP
ncbi:hypothetical protein CRG98_032341 [Punica granatum]|uniref:S-protein homolog n=1 Tax=Punica granatum TaxID=22663 RepID=A0A2I0ITD3_PUNGR|nr:hypothetical protein CRG98_032341 [Punica granatum]